MLLTLCIASYFVSNGLFWKRDELIAKNYVEMIKPHLEEFRHVLGRYPVSIGEIANLPPAPAGLIYSKMEDGYSFDYYADIYCSATGLWFEDD